MGSKYTILVNDDNTLSTSYAAKIMYRSNLVDDFRILVKPNWNGLDMSQFTAVLEYRLPVSKTYSVEVLNLSPELYKGRLEYVLPIDTKFTSEVGEIEMFISFAFPHLVEDGTIKDRVRKTFSTTVPIYDTNRWADYIPDAKLDSIAQMVLMNRALAEELRISADLISSGKADGIAKDEDTNEIYLTANGVKLGEGVIDDGIGEDGIPIILLDSDESDSGDISKPDDEDDNVVEFGYGNEVGKEPLEDSDVVEF